MDTTPQAPGAKKRVDARLGAARGAQFVSMVGFGRLTFFASESKVVYW